MDTLTLRSASASLPGSAVSGTPGTLTEILGAIGCGQRNNGAIWRIVELYSDQLTPWEATLVWSGGNGGRRTAKITVVQYARVCILASSVWVSGSALSSEDVTAWVAIADGVVTVENQYSVRGTAGIGVSADVVLTTPPYARFVRLEVADDTQYALSYITLTDGWGTARNKTRGDQQPNPGLLVGDAKTVTVTVPSGAVWRVTFSLNL